MSFIERLRSVDRAAVSKRARRAAPVGAGLFAGVGSLAGTATAVGGPVGAAVGGAIGAFLGYGYAGLRAQSAESGTE
ncbi:hypothetical protein BRC72_06870 [Halobacteriales archaeon QH_7_66_36]|nr:MAG: hypothetical protein BRC72_06870 [Halobacteriales archaeon QH_7_66_36]